MPSCSLWSWESSKCYCGYLGFRERKPPKLWSYVGVLLSVVATEFPNASIITICVYPVPIYGTNVSPCIIECLVFISMNNDTVKSNTNHTVITIQCLGGKNAQVLHHPHCKLLFQQIISYYSCMTILMKHALHLNFILSTSLENSISKAFSHDIY